MPILFETTTPAFERALWPERPHALLQIKSVHLGRELELFYDPRAMEVEVQATMGFSSNNSPTRGAEHETGWAGVGGSLGFAFLHVKQVSLKP